MRRRLGPVLVVGAVLGAALVVSDAAPVAAAAGPDLQTVIGFTGLGNPTTVTRDDFGNTYVADTFNDRVLKLPVGGGPQEVVPFTGLNHPRQVAVAPDGTIYVADTLNLRVLKLPAGGGPQAVVPITGSGNFQFFGTAVDSTGTLYVSDLTNQRIFQLPAGGGAQVVISTPNIAPWQLAVDDQDNLYIANDGANQVLRRPAAGGPLVSVGFTGLQSAPGVAVDAAGNVYVSDTDADRVLMMPAGGGVQREVPFTGIDRPYGLAVDDDGTVYVADYANSRVVAVATRPGYLRATTSPAVGGEISVDGIVRDAWGLNWAPFPPGTHEVCFGPVPGYDAPPCEDVVVDEGATTTVTGAYVAKGYLRVMTSPAVASTISVDGVARNDWGLWAEVAPGPHTVCFGAVAGRSAPACREVVVAPGATASTTGEFVVDPDAPGPGGATGFLRAVTTPPVGALITVDGEWRNTWGLDWLKVPAGSHEVCFGSVPGATGPSSCSTVNVAAGATTAVNGAYSYRGWLRVITDPAVPATVTVDGTVANSFGMWSTRATGARQVCFGPVIGYVRPPCQTPSLTGGALTTVTATYTPVP